MPKQRRACNSCKTSTHQQRDPHSLVCESLKSRSDEASQVAIKALTRTSSTSALFQPEPERSVQVAMLRGRRCSVHGARFSLMLACLFVLASLLGPDGAGAIWPFSSSAPSSPETVIKSPGASAGPLGSKRSARNLNEPLTKPVESPGPDKTETNSGKGQTLSQEFHYFWNHDQIEPGLVADEASKVLADAKSRNSEATVSINQGPASVISSESHESASKSAEPVASIESRKSDTKAAQKLGSSESLERSGLGLEGAQVVVPAPVQLQLTPMVLQMQRQLMQANLMAQPRMQLEAQRRLAAHHNQFPFGPNPIMSRLMLMPQQMQFEGAAGGPLLGQPRASQMSESVVMPNVVRAPMLGSGAPNPIGTMAGVPVYGPYMVATPPMNLAIPFAHSSGPTQVQATFSDRLRGDPIKPASSRRRSWPLGLGFMADKMSLFSASASQPRVAVAAPPTTTPAPTQPMGAQNGPLQSISHQQSHQTQPGLLMTPASHIQAKPSALLPIRGQPLGIHDVPSPEVALALLEVTSNQLANALAAHIQARAAKQKLTALLSMALDQPTNDPNQLARSASINNYIYSKPSDHFGAHFGQSNPIGQHVKPVRPYHQLTTAGLSPHTLLSHLRHFHPIELARALNESASGGLVYGTRLRRRHLSVNNSTAGNLLARLPLSTSAEPEILARSSMANSVADSAMLADSSLESAAVVEAPNEMAEKSSTRKDLTGNADASADRRLRRLFMILATESPLNPTISGGQHRQNLEEPQTQLRRLKRSSSGGWKPSVALQVEAKPAGVQESTVDPSKTTSYLRPTTLHPVSWSLSPATGWSAVSVQAGQPELLLSRRSELPWQSTSSHWRDQSAISVSPALNQLESISANHYMNESKSNRQDRSLKTNRFSTSSASALHHPTSPTRSVISMRHEVFPVTQFSGMTQYTGSQPLFAAESSQVDSKVDPISLSVAESGRVVNYFQNFENDGSSTKAPAAQPANNQRNSLTGQTPQLSNVGHSVPSSRPSSDNQNDTTSSQDQDDIKRQQQQPSQATLKLTGQGNGLSALSPDYLGSRQRAQGQASSKPLLSVAAPNADISSSATKSVSYSMKTGRGPNVSMPGPPAILTSQTGYSNPALVGSVLRQSPASLSNEGRLLLNTMLSRPSDRSSSPVSSLATSATFSHQDPQNQVQPAPEFDRSNSIDLTNQYNDDTQNGQMNAAFLPDIPGGIGASQAELIVTTMAPPSYTMESANFGEVPQGVDESLQTGNLPIGLGNSNMDSRASPNIGEANQLDQQMLDLVRYNLPESDGQPNRLHGQHYASPISNQSDIITSEIPEAQNFPTPGMTLSPIMRNQQAPDEPHSSMLLSAAKRNPISHEHQQLYTQQIQALGSAVNKLNQHRLSQQLQEIAIRNLGNPQARQFLLQPSSIWSGLDDEIVSSGSSGNMDTSLMNGQSIAKLLTNKGHQNNPNHLPDLSSMLMSGSEQARSEPGEEPIRTKKKPGKNNKTIKQVSHHYHINSFVPAFEDPDLNPLDIATALSGSPSGFNASPGRPSKEKPKPMKEQEDQEGEQEEEKPKKKGGFLRRFSLKNIFKRFKKDKKKETANEESKVTGNEGGETTNEN